MLNKIFTSAEKLLNQKLNNGTFMVLIISFCVVSTGIIVPNAQAKVSTNILEAQKNIEINQYIIIDGKKYKITLEEVE